MTTSTPKRIVILGGGFGGLYTALALDKTLARDPDIEVVLINRDNFFLFTPMLHEVAASDLDLTNIVNPIRKMLKRVKFFAGGCDAIDLENKTVTVSHGDEHHSHELPYDHLVLGLGSVTNFYGLPGLAERALTMKSLGDAIALRNRLIANLEEADFECCAHVRAKLLTVVVAGGGFAGVETAAGVNDFIRAAKRFYPNITPEQIRVVIVHSGDVVLPELSESLGQYARKILERHHVEFKLNTRVTGMTADGVELSDGSTIKTCTLVWTAGTSANPLLQSLPCTLERGRPCTNSEMEVPGFSGVWAVGDCAVIPDPKTGKPYPPTAQHAIRQGKILARNITAEIRGGKKKPFTFKTIGQLASIGRRTGVANILGVNFSGFVAWWLWRTIYLSKLPRFEKKFRVALDWTLDLLFSKDIVQYLPARSAVMLREDHAGPTGRHSAPATPAAEGRVANQPAIVSV